MTDVTVITVPAFSRTYLPERPVALSQNSKTDYPLRRSYLGFSGCSRSHGNPYDVSLKQTLASSIVL